MAPTMEPKTAVSIKWTPLGQTNRDVAAAKPLGEEMAGLTRFFHKRMLTDAQGFGCNVNIEGFAPVRLNFRPLSQTVALVLIHSRVFGGKTPDAVCLLVNGLEMPADIAAVQAQVNFPPGIWESLEVAPKPITVAAFNVNGRMRDPATTTVIHVLGNVYFNLFGTNSIRKAG